MNVRKNIVWIVLISIFYCEHIHAQSFVQVSGVAKDIAISPKDGSIYVVGSSKNVLKFDNKYKKFKNYGVQSKDALSIAVHSNGSVYKVSTSNDVYINVSERWIKVPGIKTKEVDIDKNGNIRALNLKGKLYKLFNGQWKDQTLVNRNTSGFNQIIGQDSKTLYARFKDNAFKEFKNGKWGTLNGKPAKIAMDDKTGNVYAVGRNKGIYRWNKSSKKWALLKNTRKDFVEVAVHNGKVWGITLSNRIYYYDVNAAPPNYHGNYRVTITRVFAYAHEMSTGGNIDLFGGIGAYVEGSTNSGKINLKPINGANRIYNYSRNYPSVISPVKENFLMIKNPGEHLNDAPYNGIFQIKEFREFKIGKEIDPESVYFDIQATMKQKRAIDLDFGWQRKKVRLLELVEGKEYFFTFNKSMGIGRTHLTIGFKIEKR